MQKYPSILYLALSLIGLLSGSANAHPETLKLFQQKCANCHAADGREEEPFLSEPEDLREVFDNPDYVVPGDPGRSELYTLLTLSDGHAKRMPRSRGTPGEKSYRLPLNEEELAAVRSWIMGNANEPPRKWISESELDRLVEKDLRSLPRMERTFTRYLDLSNLYNRKNADGRSYFPESKMAQHRAALSKILNSLSWAPKLVPPTAINPERTLFRINLKDYRWTTLQWHELAESYPYASSNQRTARRITQMAGNDRARVRGDWFVFTVSQPPFYYELLGLPGSEEELEALVGIDTLENLERGNAQRSGFQRSGVSQANRLIERHELPSNGAYWKSYDFDRNSQSQAQDLFTHPLGPQEANLSGAFAFKHDGGEIIFNLPNGLQAYYLSTSAGDRLDIAPTDIVQDRNRRDSSIINGISCINCHRDGVLQPPKGSITDEVYAIARRSLRFSRNEKRSMNELYGRPDDLQKRFNEDSKRFTAALEALDARSPEGEVVHGLYTVFLRDLDRETFAGELGLCADELMPGMARSGNDRIRAVAQRLNAGGRVARRDFIELYRLITLDLSLGKLLDFTPVAVTEFGASNSALTRPDPSIESLRPRASGIRAIQNSERSERPSREVIDFWGENN